MSHRKALGSNLNNTQKELVANAYNLSTCKVEAGQPEQHREFEASLKDLRLFLGRGRRRKNNTLQDVF